MPKLWGDHNPMKLHLAATGTFDTIFNNYLPTKHTGGTAKLRAALHSGQMLTDYYQPQDLALIKDANLLQSFYYLNPDSWIPNNLTAIGHFLCDSGIFTIVYGSHKGGMDDKKIRKYADAYADYVKTFNIQHYFELDLDSLIGETETLHLRDRLENRVGWQTIPVWHINRGKDGWLRDLDHPYIAIGGFANCHGKGRKILAPILPWMVREAHTRQTWVHALGYTDMRMLETNTYNFDSVDSTAWTFGGMSGTIFTFNGYTLVKHKAPKGKRLETGKACAQNFRAWLQYSRMLDNRHPNTIQLRPPQGWAKR